MRALTPEQLLALRAVPAEVGSNRLRVALALVGASQSELVEATGFAQPYVSDVLRGRFKDITVGRARRFADCFGCLIEDLFPTGAGNSQGALPFVVGQRRAVS